MISISSCQYYFCYSELKQSSEFNMYLKSGSYQLRTAFLRNLTKIQKSTILQPHVKSWLQFEKYHINGTISLITVSVSIRDKSERRSRSPHILACLAFFSSLPGLFLLCLHSVKNHQLTEPIFFLHLLHNLALTSMLSTCNFEFNLNVNVWYLGMEAIFQQHYCNKDWPNFEQRNS